MQFVVEQNATAAVYATLMVVDNLNKPWNTVTAPDNSTTHYTFALSPHSLSVRVRAVAWTSGTVNVKLATWALTTIGTMFSALTVNLRLRELMLPTLVYPLMVPALMAAMTLTTDLLGGTPLNPENMIWLRVLVAFDFIFTALAVVFVDTVLVG